MFRHVREIIGEDVAAFLARVRDAERRASANGHSRRGARSARAARPAVAAQHSSLPEPARSGARGLLRAGAPDPVRP